MENSNTKNIVSVEVLDKVFPHIAGYDEIRREAYQIVDIFKNPELYKERGGHCPKGWLLYGAPGTGKSRIVLDMRDYLVDVPFFEISYSKAVEENKTIDQQIVECFSAVEKIDRGIIFIDEIEKVAGYHNGLYDVKENLPIQKLLLHELDKIRARDGVIVIGTCNDLMILGPALSRSGRFDRQISFNRPHERDRRAILTHFLKDIKIDNDVSLDEMVRLSSGLTGADIESAVNEAVIKSVSERRGTVAISDFQAVIDRIKTKDVARDNLLADNELKYIAYHEAGHAYVTYCLAPERLNSATIVKQGSALGRVSLTALSDEEVLTKARAENQICAALGGVVAVEVMTGTQTYGAQGDLESARDDINDMLNNGIYGVEYINLIFNAHTFSEYYGRSYLDDRTNKIIELLKEFESRDRELIEKGRDEVEALASALVAKKALSSLEIKNIIEEVRSKKISEHK